MLEPLGKGLLGTTLRYAYEVRSEQQLLLAHTVAALYKGHGVTCGPYSGKQSDQVRSG